MKSCPKIGLIGPRTHNQGTGPWLSKFFHQNQCPIVTILGTSPESSRQAAEDLKKRFQIDCRPTSRWEDFRQFPIDLLVLASPPHTHHAFLKKALDEKIAVFCEKPLVWDWQRDNLNDAQEIIAGFEQENIFLRLNTQWPESLEAFQVLYPKCSFNDIQSFKIELSPSSQGAQMFVDALPHALSLLTTICGVGVLNDLQIKATDTSALIEGKYRSEKSDTQFTAQLTHTPQQPRPFAYEINGYRVERVINPKDYALSFKTNAGIFPIIDPVARRVENVVKDWNQGSDNEETQKILTEMELLVNVLSQYLAPH